MEENSSCRLSVGDCFSDALEKLNVQHICAKDRTRTIGRIMSLGNSIAGLIEEHFLSISQTLSEELSDLEGSFEAILSGKRKNSISSSWLTDIRDSVNDLLRKRGFDAEAVPHDYISTAPSSLSSVRANLVILQTLLNNSDDSSALNKVSEELKAKIYPIIAKFIEEALFVSGNVLQVDQKEEAGRNAAEVLQELKDVIKQKKETGEEVDERVVGVLSDVEYLHEMKRLEDNPQDHNPHIVPVSGLVYSSIIRKEKETLTVLEVWEGV
jgi:hypothetical protein